MKRAIYLVVLLSPLLLILGCGNNPYDAGKPASTNERIQELKWADNETINKISYSPKGKEAELKKQFQNTSIHGQGKYADIDYWIVYKKYAGYTTCNQNGIYYHHTRYGGVVTWERIILPSVYYNRSYPMYYIGEYMYFEIRLKSSAHKYKNLRIVAIQEYLNPDGGDGEDLPGQSTAEWRISEINPNEEVVLTGTYYIPYGTHSGLDQTHLRIYTYNKTTGNGDNMDDPNSGNIDQTSDGDSGQGNDGKLIIDDDQAAVWCPPPDDLGLVVYEP